MKPAFQSTIQELVVLARQGKQAQLASKLGHFLTDFEQFLSHVSVAQQEALLTILPKLLRHQESEDWHGFADVLEYDLLTHL